jgi:hypothetical protein
MVQVEIQEQDLRAIQTSGSRKTDQRQASMLPATSTREAANLLLLVEMDSNASSKLCLKANLSLRKYSA